MADNASLPQLTLEDLKESLDKVLEDSTRPSAFACSEPYAEFPNPGLSIADYGHVGLPLSDRDAKAIIANCRKSPFGRGADTVVDDTVRRSWELDASQFTLRNPAWGTAISSVLAKLHDQLGLLCPFHEVRAEPYKLLIYEEGAFFKSHQDSEKTPGMFGTLVISLPSSHEGGDLVLRHSGAEVSIKTSTASVFGYSWASWYSDVFHEVKPVTQGIRLMLTYNLAVNPNSGSERVTIPPTLSAYTSRIKQLLRDWDAKLEQSPSEFPRYLVYNLDHQYTSANLGLNGLKGSDRDRADCLKTAAAETGAAVFLATAELEIVKDDDEDYGDGEEYDRNTSLKDVMTLEGKVILRSLEYDDEQVINEREFDEDSPDDEYHTGFTGNEGQTATYWYRDTVCLLVPRAALDQFRFNGPYKWRWAQKRLQELRQSPPPSDCIRFCETLLNAHDESAYVYRYTGYADEERDARDACMKDVACISLEANQLDMFEVALQKQKGPLPAEAVYHLGRCFALSDPTKADKLFPQVLSSCEGLASRHRAFEQFTRGFNELTEVTDSLTPELMTNWRRWFKKTLLTRVFVATGELTRADGVALAILYSSISDEDARDGIRHQISQGSRASKIGFCIHLTALKQQQQHPNDDDTHTRQVIRALVGNIWLDFCLDNRRVAPGTRLIPLPENARDAFPTADDIVELVRLVGLYEDPPTPEPQPNAEGTVTKPPLDPFRFSQDICPSRILFACQAADHFDIVGTFLPFIRLVVANKVPFLLTPDDDDDDDDDDDKRSTDAAKKIVRCIVRRFVKLVIGKKPQAPTTWTIQARSGCRCADCLRVNAFLASPTERVGRFPMGKGRRQHLHQQFNDYRVAAVDYNIETLRNSNPNVWQMTKNRNGFANQLKQWTTRKDLAWPMLSSLLADQPDEHILVQYLGGDLYMAIKNGDITTLLGGPPPGPLSALNETNANGKRARPAADGPSAPASGKRVASGNAGGHHPVIDLTRE